MNIVRSLVVAFSVLSVSAMVMTAHGDTKPGFGKPKPEASVTTSAAATSTTSPKKTWDGTKPLTGSTSWDDGLYHVVVDGVVSKGFVDIDVRQLSITKSGELLYPARVSDDGNKWHVVIGDAMSESSYSAATDLRQDDNEHIVFKVDYVEYIDFAKPAFARSSYGVPSWYKNDAAPVGTGTSYRPYKDESDQLPERTCGGVKTKSYVIAKTEPLAVVVSGNGYVVCWGADVTRVFGSISHLAFESGKVSYVGVNIDTDETEVVVWNGVESKKLKFVGDYQLKKDGTPVYWGTSVDDKNIYTFTGTTASRSFGDVKGFKVVDDKVLYVARKPDAPVKLDAKKPDVKKF